MGIAITLLREKWNKHQLYINEILFFISIKGRINLLKFITHYNDYKKQEKALSQNY
jgi:hypothetical protein